VSVDRAAAYRELMTEQEGGTSDEPLTSFHVAIAQVQWVEAPDRQAGGYWEFSMGGQNMDIVGPNGEKYSRDEGDAVRAEARRLVADRLVVVLPDTDDERAAGEARSLAARLDQLPVPAAATPHFRGASVGWATAAPNEDNETLLRRAAAEMKTRKTRRAQT
jgi:hypothetical protein